MGSVTVRHGTGWYVGKVLNGKLVNGWILEVREKHNCVRTKRGYRDALKEEPGFRLVFSATVQSLIGEVKRVAIVQRK